jgi:hypothetical protein
MRVSKVFVPSALFLLICGVVVGHKDENGHGQGILNDGEGNEMKTKEELMRLWDFEVSETGFRLVSLFYWSVCAGLFCVCGLRCDAMRCKTIRSDTRGDETCLPACPGIHTALHRTVVYLSAARQPELNPNPQGSDFPNFL